MRDSNTDLLVKYLFVTLYLVGSGRIHPFKKAHFHVSGTCFPLFVGDASDNMFQIFKCARMGYWNIINNAQRLYKSPEKINCKICGKEIPLGSYPQIMYGVGIIYRECSDNRWRKNNTN